MTSIRTYATIAFETTLSGSLGVGATTINVVDTSGSPAVPFYLTLEPASDDGREVVLVTGKTSTTFTLGTSANRGLDGTTDIAHNSGASVKVVPVAAVINDLHDRVDEVETTAGDAYTPGGTDVAVADGGTGASTAAAARTNLAVVGTGDTSTAGFGFVVDEDAMTSNSATKVPTQQSVKAYVDTQVSGSGAYAPGGADVAVADGGTGASTAAAARTNLAVVGTADTDASGFGFIVDEDDMTSDSATKVPTQQSVKAYVDTEVSGFTSVDRTAITGFTQRTTLTGQMQRLIITNSEVSSGSISVVMHRGGSITGLSVAVGGVRTSGTLAFEVYKNDVATGLTVTIDGTNTQYHYATQAAGTDTFTAGQRLDVRQTSSSFGPDTGAEAVIWVELT